MKTNDQDDSKKRGFGENDSMDDELDLQDEEFEEEEEEEEEIELDPWAEKIEAYLDDEMPPEEKKEFEKILQNDPELKERVDNEREAWDALDLLDVEDNDVLNIAEKAVDRLNSETQAELRLFETQTRRRRRVFLVCEIAAAILFSLAGYFLFSYIFPDIETKRERDCRVVERLTVLESVGSFDYLTELFRSELFSPPTDPEWKKNWRQSAQTQQLKSYAELSQDRTFYRNQQSFESLDSNAQNALRELYQQIENTPNPPELWHTAYAYTFWLRAATNFTEREQLAAQTIPERIETIRKKNEFFKQLQKFSTAANPTQGPGAPQGPQGPKASPNRQWQAENPVSPIAAAIRVSLPQELRGEDLEKLYRKFKEYQRLNGPGIDVVGFLTKVDKGELIESTSESAQKYLKEQTPDALDSTLGLLVTLSYLEYDRPKTPFSNPQNEFGYNKDKNFNGGQNANLNLNGPAWRPGFNTIGALAETLKKAPDGAKEYIFSNPPQEAWTMLLGLHWREGQDSEFRRGPGPKWNTDKNHNGFQGDKPQLQENAPKKRLANAEREKKIKNPNAISRRTE